MNKRLGMLESSLQRAISAVVQREISDPRLGFITVTSVRLSPDSRHARVYISVLGESVSVKESISVLRRSAGLIKAGIKPVVTMRFMPELEFIEDDTARKAEKIERLIQEIHEDDDTADEDPPAE